MTLPTQHPYQVIPCIVQSEEKWIQELTSRFQTIEELAFKCDCGHVQTIQDVCKKNLPMYQVFRICLRCGMESEDLVGSGRLIVRKNGYSFMVFDYVELK